MSLIAWGFVGVIVCVGVGTCAILGRLRGIEDQLDWICDSVDFGEDDSFAEDPSETVH